MGGEWWGEWLGGVVGGGVVGGGVVGGGVVGGGVVGGGREGGRARCVTAPCDGWKGE